LRIERGLLKERGGEKFRRQTVAPRGGHRCICQAQRIDRRDARIGMQDRARYGERRVLRGRSVVEQPRSVERICVRRRMPA
jgi:hypothetical protein